MGERRVRVVFDVELPLERVWSILSDTQRINEQVFLLQPSKVVRRDAQKARIQGTFGSLAPEYDEYPWVFEVPRYYRSRRVFSRGFLNALEFHCALKTVGSQTNVVLESVIRGAPGGVGSVVAFLTARSVRSGMKRAEALLRSATFSPEGRFVWPQSPAPAQSDVFRERALKRIEPLEKILAADDKAILAQVVDHVATATDADVAFLRPYVLAAQWGKPRRAVLAMCLRVTHAGLLRLSWDLLCPSCEAPTTVASLQELPAGGHCPACDIDFSVDFARNVEATFHPEPAVRAAARLVFCHGSPSSTPSWIAQFVVGAGETRRFETQLGPGRYRLQGQGIDTPWFFDVADGAASHELHATAQAAPGARARLTANVDALAPGACSLVVVNGGHDPRRFQMAFRAFATQAATAADVTGLGLFRELFGADALSPTQHLAVGQRTILFTDLVGSTAMYERVGDAAAYGLVRRHFDLLRAEIARENGVVVKTVGDAVMASFDLAEEGARAGLACIEALRTLTMPDGSPSGLSLRVGVHTGACLAVDANGAVDYFGRTVNLAARVESLGARDELVLSWAMVEDSAVAAFLDRVRALGHEVTSDVQQVKGVHAPVKITRLSVRGGAS